MIVVKLKKDSNTLSVKRVDRKVQLVRIGRRGPKGDTGSPEWGKITGDISDQDDLQQALDNKININDAEEFAIAMGIAL